MAAAHHRCATVRRRRLFYREGGPADGPAVVLPDGFPASSFGYTFDPLAGLTADLLDQLGIARYAMYVQDYGAPAGWRLALNDLGAVTAVVTQNGNGYEAGFTEAFWKPVRAYWQDRSPQSEAGVRQALEESHLDTVADHVRGFLGRTLA